MYTNKISSPSCLIVRGDSVVIAWVGENDGGVSYTRPYESIRPHVAIVTGREQMTGGRGVIGMSTTKAMLQCFYIPMC